MRRSRNGGEGRCARFGVRIIEEHRAYRRAQLVDAAHVVEKVVELGAFFRPRVERRNERNHRLHVRMKVARRRKVSAERRQLRLVLSLLQHDRFEIVDCILERKRAVGCREHIKAANENVGDIFCAKHLKNASKRNTNSETQKCKLWMWPWYRDEQ